MRSKVKASKLTIHRAIYLFLFLLLLTTPLLLAAQTEGFGTLSGFIYEQDGVTPIQGTVVKIKNLEDGNLYQSLPSDSNGAFIIDTIKEGLYIAGITTPTFNFNSSNLIGIKAGETTKIAFSLTPPQEEIPTIEAFTSPDFPPKNEIRVGRVIEFDSEMMQAYVFMEEGVLRRGDNIRVLGKNTDFYQKLEKIFMKIVTPEAEDIEEVKAVHGGQTFFFDAKTFAEVGDYVYYVKKKQKAFAFFLTPCGIASILAGTIGTIAIIKKPKDEEDVSPYK